MADLIARADGNLTAAATWGLVDSTSFLESESAWSYAGTAYTETSGFTPGAIQVDGIAIKVQEMVDNPSGTITIRLAQGGVLVAGTEVTMDLADIVSTEQYENGWIFFKFAAPVTLLAATVYTMSVKSSVAFQIQLFRDFTANNFSRMLRTTTTQAPVAGDRMFVLGENTGSGTRDTRTVTMDSTAATDYGNGSTSFASLGISAGGVLTWGTTASTNYILQVSGHVQIWAGGVMNMGTVATPCPRSSTQTLQIDCASDGQFGLTVMGSLNMQGSSPLAGVDNHFALLAADAAAAAVNMTTDRQLSAASGQDIAIASTTRTVTQAETRVMNGDAGATSLAVTVGLTNAHSGSSPTQAEVISLTRNVRIQSVSSTFMSYVRFYGGTAAGAAAPTVDADWAQFRYLGYTNTGTRGVELNATNGNVSLNKCSFRDFDNHGFYVLQTNGACPFEVTDCVFYKVGHQTSSHGCVYVNEQVTGAWSVTGCVSVSNNSGQGFGIRFNDVVNATVEDNRWTSGGGYGMYIADEDYIQGSIANNVAHSMGLAGLHIAGCFGGTISDTTVWRTSTYGIQFSSGTTDILFDGFTLFGNATAGIVAEIWLKNVTFRDGVLAGDTSFGQTKGFYCSTAYPLSGIRFENCTFGVTSGILTTHSVADVDFGSVGSNWRTGDYVFVKCTRSSATEFLNKSELHGRSFVSLQRDENVADVNEKEYPNLGSVEIDTVTYRTASPSVKIIPTSAPTTMRLQSPFRVPVASGQAATVSVYVNKSVAYNGSAPRLRVAYNPAAGIDEATLATHASAAGSFVQLTGTTPTVTENCWLEFYVDADGSAGQVNIDDWSWSVA